MPSYSRMQFEGALLVPTRIPLMAGMLAPEHQLQSVDTVKSGKRLCYFGTIAH